MSESRNSASTLSKKKINPKDEFYTRMEDIVAELEFYPDAFRDKVVYLNCDKRRSSSYAR